MPKSDNPPSNRSLRILVVSQYFWPENFRINDLVDALAVRGHEITILTGSPNYPDGVVFSDFAATPAKYSSYKGVPVFRVPMAARGSGAFRLVLNYITFAVSAAIIGPLKLRGRSFDAIFVFEPSPITVGFPAIVLRRFKRTPVALWVLDLWPESLSAVGAVRTPTVLRLVGRLVSFIYRRCDLILAQSRRFIPEIQRRCGSVPVVYFPNWAEDTFAATDAIPAPEIPAAANTFDIVFAGNIGEAQDFPAILDAADLLRDEPVRWLIVGDGRKLEWVRREIAVRGLGDKVLLIGRFPVERMPEFFAAADALLVSLRSEPIFALTIPAKLQAYLAAGIPILAMIDGEGADVVRDAQAGLACAAGDSAGLAEAVKAMVALPEAERFSMGQRGQEFARREFSRDMLIEALEHWLGALSEKVTR
ncbi:MULTISPECIES: glycosyltransferase family 4 protein [Phyllobacteriaceae]|jgi:colanic acid biosynthesis glycosyl transferase WcaI|uniref:Glycosyltransferase WbuB n=1 Tax=Mesorhizobium hungaricum TaxID=1566387 RepID=A0A1C2DJ82_9HYPH|nr:MULTISPECIES: glycosyltransferase family 4 protein [Mesorhizobium]MDQ0332101.1 glycosyltransferase involved in cell wall biosynthesis [Mesorhizobium sp. YL-MeA3-2017]OCX14818.1 glycosyltransferase WbuB [Mesorhizobium hungaricum]